MLARIRASRGRSSEFFCEFSGAECSDHTCGCEESSVHSMMTRNQVWIFGVKGGSVASVTIGTDDLWDELVLDSGSVSTACPYAWCSDISVNNEDKVYLQDIQQRRIPSHGSRVVLLELWVQRDVLSAKSSLTLLMLRTQLCHWERFSFDDYKCYMHKGNQRVEMFRKGRIFVLRMRRRWLESKVQMVAPIDEVAEEEMEIDDDGEERNHVRMNLEMNHHHHHGHERYDKVQYDQEQKLYANTI